MGQCLTRQNPCTKCLHVPLELVCTLNFKTETLVTRSFRGCQPQTKHFPSIWPWLLMSRMVNILLGLFILLPFCSLSCMHRYKGHLQRCCISLVKRKKRKSYFFCLDLCPSFTVGEARWLINWSPGSSIIYQKKMHTMAKLSPQSNQLFQK